MTALAFRFSSASTVRHSFVSADSSRIYSSIATTKLSDHLDH
jgi:hypothetical protein